MKKIYIAGFDVFAPDAIERGEKMKKLCREYGFVGFYPFDNEADTAKEIFAGNCKLIDDADIIIANLNCFRGKEPDSGTSFEVGYAFAKGKKIYGYLEDARTMRQKYGDRDENGFGIEDFDYPLNLMLCEAAEIIEGDFEKAIMACKQKT